ncbi:MAG: class I SAM-dependent methyltransferase [Syntrophomonas sp.]
MNSGPYDRFKNLTYEGFKELAGDKSLSCYEKIGFPNEYREGKEQAIFQDILLKTPRLQERGKVVLDIGCGCSELPLMIMDYCEKNDHELILIDSAEMLELLPDRPRVKKLAAYFPEECADLLDEYAGKIDVIICYSLLHYIIAETNLFSFLDSALSLLREEGAFLIGDIPNISKRKRFFASNTGVAFHKAFMQTSEPPEVAFNNIECGQIDDAVVFALLQRARLAGFDAYVVPQSAGLPMANRREDILIYRP